MYATILCDVRPHSGGHWLKTLSVLNDLRIWWAETDAHEEYLDRLLTPRRAKPGQAPVRQPVGDRWGAEGHRSDEQPAGRCADRPAESKPIAKSRRQTSTTARKAPTPRAADANRRVAEPNYMSQEGLDRLTVELNHLKTEVRPEVITRVATARSHGDLKENAEYEYARKEQSFTEGRIQTLEALIRTAVLAERPAPNAGAQLGSTVVIESDGDKQTYRLVSSAEANAGAGRIPMSHP